MTGRRVTAARLARLGGTVALGMVVAFAWFVGTAEGLRGPTGMVGGDWAAFYGAGLLARTDPTAILDVQAQLDATAPYLASSQQSVFAYPPVVAFLFAPVTLLSFKTSYVVAVVLLVGAAAAAIHLTMDVLDIPSRWRTVGMLGGLTFVGTFLSVAGAQNTTITLLILAGGFRMLQAGRSPWLAGAVFSLLWFKPQFAVPTLGLLAVCGHARTSGVAVLGAPLLWVANAVVLGPGWFESWLAGPIQAQDAGARIFNTGDTVSPVEYTRGVVAGQTGDLIAVTIAVLIGTAAVAIVRRRQEIGLVMPITCAALLLTAPHAQRYELTLLIPVLGAIAVRERGPWPVAVGAWVAGWPLVLAPAPVRITIVVLLAAMLVTYRRVPAHQGLVQPR